MLKERLLDIFEKHQGKILGSLFGLIVAIVFLTVGFFKTIFILILVAIGYYFGKKIDNRENIGELLDRILPPGKLK
ncbi:DUF2273 domain-containing protein [Caldisalinibacter kiritimatiensis]|uniref:Small integral membrane protein n=1 Tax=Caldisalinibacter kiritimatiensis TaxID=1304284 RepID=R1CSU8_9FIRM|nr:DUF2273 domain-containing protein [Caldisalinibacter kiritimatiensis]EOD01731.1 hypothetical protein L21TH_0196 [Caldisalinibacter kiritimatiensis]